ncbi:MAG: hypothetical protein ACTSX6_10580 [Candidatus Heimdallarchaeaceae archaeon]
MSDVDVWTLMQDHKDLKRALRKIQRTLDFYQKTLEVERKKRYEVEQVLSEEIREVRRDYRKLRPKLNRVRERVYQIILDKPGLTYAEIAREYERRYRHHALTGNRIRELFKEKRVIKVMGADGYLHWYPRVRK